MNDVTGYSLFFFSKLVLIKCEFSIVQKPIFHMLWMSLMILHYHHRIVDKSIRFIFFYSSDIFHTIIIKSDNKQV
jgi:hypothetical protein